MKLTALEIRKHEFARGFRGYNPEEVDAFLHMVAQQYQQLIDDYKALEQMHEERSVQLDQFRREEHAMRELLQTARDGAQRRLDEAQLEADRVLEDADNRAGHRLDDAERRAIDIVRSAEKERQFTRRETARIAVRQSEIVARLRAFLASEMEVLQRFEADEAGYRADDGMLDDEPSGAAPVAAVAGIAAVLPDTQATESTDDGGTEWDDEVDLNVVDESSLDSQHGNGLDVVKEVVVDEEVAGEDVADEGVADDDSADQAELDPIEDDTREYPDEAPSPTASDAAPAVVAAAQVDPETPDLTETVEPKQPTPEPIRLRRRPQPARQGDLMDDADGDDATGATEEIRKIRRILEDLDR